MARGGARGVPRRRAEEPRPAQPAPGERGYRGGRLGENDEVARRRRMEAAIAKELEPRLAVDEHAPETPKEARRIDELLERFVAPWRPKSSEVVVHVTQRIGTCARCGRYTDLEVDGICPACRRLVEAGRNC